MPVSRLARARDERGLVLPSPVVMLSIVAVLMAAVAFVATRNAPAAEREIAPAAQQPTATPTPTTFAPPEDDDADDDPFDDDEQ